MNSKLLSLLDELERFGIENDGRKVERDHRMLNISRDVGEFLNVFVRATKARRILEVGTSNGYATLWLAGAVQPLGGVVDTVEKSSYKFELARTNFARAGLADFIRPHLGNAAKVLKGEAVQVYDFIFLDSKQEDYLAWWPDLRKVLVRGGVLVVNNATAHPQEMANFVAELQLAPEFVTALIPVGGGELIAHKSVH